MEATVTIIEGLIFIVLVVVYYRLNHDRHSSKLGKLAEIIALYGVSIWAMLGHLKFIVWALLIAAIGMIKFLTTKKAKIERRIEGRSNNI